MDESHSLLLNEEAFKACPDAKKPVFIYEWLRYLDRILPVTHKNDLRTVQVQLLQQLEARLASVTGPPTRQLLAKCIARVYVTGDSYSLFGTINACNDTLKNKEDSPSQLQAKFAALCCLGALYESVGRLVGRTYEDSIAICVKWLKSADSQGRAEIMSTLSSMITGLGSAASNKHKELYRAARDWVTDRVMTVRMAAVLCITALVPFYSPLYTTELESACTLCVKALEGSNYETRVAVAKLFSALIANAIQPPPGATMVSRSGPIPIVPQALDDCLHLLSTAFLRGGIGGFLRTTSGSTATAGGHREIRVGVSMGYVELIREMGVSWLERNLGAVCKHLLELASKGGVLAYTTNQAQASEAVVIRRCVSYILRATVGEMLSENSQMTACKYLGSLLADYINSFDCTTDGVDRILEGDAYASGFAASAALLEISALVRQIGTAVTPLFVEASGIMEPVFACLLHPVPSARAATAWCLRCITLAVPSQLTPLIDRCISRLEHMRASSDAISGYSLALAALIAAAADCKLGIPHAKPKQVLQCAEDMLRTASQQSRLAVAKINAGWILLHALVSLGPSVMKDHIPKVSQLWRVAFPRSVKEAQAEKDRGDAFSWQCSLEARAGALAVMAAVAEQKDLCDDETIKSMLLPVECAVVNMGQVGALIRSYGNKMRSMICVVRIRVYGLLMLLPSKSCENFFGPLMSELVADLTLSDNVQSTLMTSQAASMCTSAEHTLLFPWHDATDQSMIENQLQCQSGSVCSFENDFNCIVSGSAKDIHDMWPEPDSPQSACLDAAVHAYGKIFPLVASKHKQQITAHFMEVIKNSSRVGPRQAAIQLNVLCALAGACRTICEHRGAKIDNEQLKTTSFSLIVAGLVSANPLTRCVAAEAMGRLSQAVGDPQYVASMAQHCFDRLNVKNSRDANGRAGYVLALGCLHRHVGSLGSGQHLHTGVSIMLALAQDNTTPLVQAWSLVSLALIAETGGGMFRGYVEPVLSACLSLLLNALATNVEVVQGIGKLLSALMTYVGPDLASHGPIDALRGSLLAACAIQLAHPDPLVKAEAIAGLQQMHLYAPRYVDINHLVVDIATFLTSSHLCLRKAAVCCLRQLVQREAKEVREHAQVLVPQGVVDEGKKLPLPDTGLEGALFGMLDAETHPALRSHVQETLISLVQATCGELLNHWLSLCKDILATSSDNTRSTLIVEDKKEKEADDDEEGGDDDATLQGAKGPVVVDKGKLQPRWPTRVFATQIVQRLMSVCDTERAHLDLALAKELQMSSGGRADYLVLHLSDLVRMSFMGATSDNTELRLAGLLSLQDVINRFSAVPEPEFPGHVILEQFQAQVGAALRPAFTEDTPSHVTAAACQVCSTWIGSGVARDLNDLRRVHQLLVSSLGKLKHGSINTQLYSESAATLEKMSILKAWAEVYVTGIEQERREDERRRDKETTTTDSDDIDAPSESLLSLVKPELNSLVCFWLAALRDWALLSLPSVLSDQLPPNGGAFYKSESAEVCREYYRNSWPPLLLASSIWLNQTNFKLPDSKEAPETWPDNTAESRFHLMVGIAVDALCSRTTYIDDATIQTCVRAITALLSCEWCQLQLMTDVRLSIELCNVLHRLILTRDSLTTQQLCVDCARSVLDAAKCAMRLSSSADMENGNLPASTPSTPLAASVFKGGEGTSDGIAPATTLTFAMMELCLCLMVRQMPQINSAQMKSKSLAPLHLRRFGRLPADSANLIRSGIQLLVQVPSLCSPEGRLVVLPVILYLVIGFVRESARIDESSVVPDLPPGHLTLVATTSIQALRTIASTPPTDSTLTQWTTIIRSALYSMLLLTEGDAAMDHCVLMLACVVMASVAPRSVVLGHPPSFHRLITLIKSQLVSEHHQVVSKTVQSVTSLFARRDACGPFVKHLGVEVFDIIRPLVTGQNVEQRVKDISEEYLPVVQDTIKAIEVLVSTSDEKKKLSLVSLVTQALCRLICASNADEWRHLSPAARRLHDFAIARLNTIAPTWPHLFKQVLAAHPDVKKRLEGALMFQSSRQTQAQQAAKAKAMENKNSMTAQPKIKLTMDFNAFGKVSS